MKIILAIFVTSVFFLSGCATGNKITENSIKPNKNSQTNNNIKTDESPAVKSEDKLDLSNQQLDKIPANVFEQSNLEELNISGNALSGSIQAEIRHLRRLKVLNASNNLMTGVPAEIGQLENLEELDLSNNQLTGLPYELGNLKNLKTLNISGNNYSEADLKIITDKLPQGVNIIK